MVAGSVTRYLHHVTLTTGHARRSWRKEVSDAALAVCAELIERITAGEAAQPARIPGAGGYYLAGRAAGRCLVATVWSGAPSVVIATIGVAAHSRCGVTLWRELHRWGSAPVATDPEHCPPEPWVAAALEAGIAEHPEAARWLGDLERCLGWAWVERHA